MDLAGGLIILGYVLVLAGHLILTMAKYKGQRRGHASPLLLTPRKDLTPPWYASPFLVIHQHLDSPFPVLYPV